jgi:hypothetical protein
MSAGPPVQPPQFGHLSHLDPHYHSGSRETTTPSGVVGEEGKEKKYFSCVGTMRSIASLQRRFQSRYFPGAGPHTCGVSII